MWYMHMCAQVQDMEYLTLSIILCFILLRQDLSLSLQQGWQPPSVPTDPPVSTTHSTGGRGTGAHIATPCLCYRSEFRSSCLHSKPPHSQAVSPAQEWSLALVFRSQKGTEVDVSFSLLIRTFVIIWSEWGSFHRPPALDPWDESLRHF